MKKTLATRLALVGTLSLLLFTYPSGRIAYGFDWQDIAAIGSAYATHLTLHELGHQTVAHDVGAVNSNMQFFASRGGTFYPAISTYDSIPAKSKLPYAAGGERMSGVAFDYALESYREKPTTYNQALMFFSSVDFLAYTVLSNYVYDDNDMSDPSLIRKETGISKGLLLSMVMGKTLINAYRVMNPEANFAPIVWVDDDSAALLLRFQFN